jgi:Glucose / Sorbosone dehydrogenase/PASTA domain
MRIRSPLVGFLAVLALLVAARAGAGSAADGDLELAPVGVFSAPIYVAAPPDDGERLFVVEQGGTIRLVRNGTPLSTPFLDITTLVLFGGERGLFSIAFASDYAVSGRFYVYYTAREPEGELTVAEYLRSANPDVAAPSGRIVLSVPHSTYGNHNGGQLQFGPDGYLYIATGDGGGGGDPDRNAQNLSSLLGKLLRIDPRQGPAGESYTIPPGNPFVGTGARAEIWAYGLRNPWRFSFDRKNGDLTIGDVGQASREEIDFLPASAGSGRGANLGWSCWEGTLAYQPNYAEAACAPARAAHTGPVWEYSHTRGCSITGGYVVRDPELPILLGRYLYGDLCDDRVWSALLQVPAAQDDRVSGVEVPSLYSFGEDACGRVYTVSGSGSVSRLHVAGRPNAATCVPLAQPPPQPPGPQPPPPVPPLPPSPPPSPPPASPPTLRPELCKVPRVIGLRAAAARTRIRRTNCRVGTLRYRRSARPRGRVLTQAPRAGARRPRGARVSFTVSRGHRR